MNFYYLHARSVAMKKEMRRVAVGIVVSLLMLLPMSTMAADAINLSSPPIAAMGMGESFLSEEAGIAAYGQATGVNLELAATGFKAIEKQTENYVVGSVSIDGYTEDHDVHVYIDAAGWMVAYYVNHELPGKIVDWVNYDGVDISSTKLKMALDNILAAQYLLPFSTEQVSYYHFGWPDATQMLIVTDEMVDTGTEYFYITVPTSGISIYQRTYAHAVESLYSYGSNSILSISDEALSDITISNYEWGFAEGELTPLQLYPGIRTEFSLSNGYGARINCYAAVVILYSEQ
jgi:hypothetical protein